MQDCSAPSSGLKLHPKNWIERMLRGYHKGGGAGLQKGQLGVLTQKEMQKYLV